MNSEFEPTFFENLTFPSMPPPIGLILKWDGTDIGDITEYVLSHKKIEYGNCIDIWTRVTKVKKSGEQTEVNKLLPVKILKFKNEIPLISDEFKSLFKVPQTGMHKATFSGTECIIQRTIDDIPLDKYLEKTPKNKITPLFYSEIRKIFAFRWLMCLNCNYENKLDVRVDGGSAFPISCKETTFSLDGDKNACRIPKNVLKEWFENKEEIFQDTVKELLNDRDPNYLKIEIVKIINKYSNKYIGWANSIYNKVIQFT
jgi:hypothetical protein